LACATSLQSLISNAVPVNNPLAGEYLLIKSQVCVVLRAVCEICGSTAKAGSAGQNLRGATAEREVLGFVNLAHTAVADMFQDLVVGTDWPQVKSSQILVDPGFRDYWRVKIPEGIHPVDRLSSWEMKIHIPLSAECGLEGKLSRSPQKLLRA
jgi:hypothetical protein